jgi:hypothetical protein
MTLASTLAAALALVIGLQAPAVAQAAKNTEVRVLGSTSSILLTPATPESVSHNRQIAFLSFSSKSYRFRGDRAAVRVPGGSPSLELTGSDPIDADDVWVVRLHRKDGSRVVGHTSSPEHPYDKGDVIGTTVTPATGATPQALRLKFDALAPGEYTVIVGRLFFDFGVD